MRSSPLCAKSCLTVTAWYYLEKVAALPSDQGPFYLTCTNLPKEPWQPPVLLHLLPVAWMAVQCSVGCGVVALSRRTLSFRPLSMLGMWCYYRCRYLSRGQAIAETQNTHQQLSSYPLLPILKFKSEPLSSSELNILKWLTWCHQLQ